MFQSLPHLWVISAITRPAIFIVAHCVYVGPVIIVALWRGRSIARLVARHGLGLQLVFLVSFVLTLNAESRQLLHFWPFLIAALSCIVATERWPVAQFWTAAVATLAFSKVWLAINRQPFGGDALVFPLQAFFMNIGPWMNTRMYLVQGGICIVTALLFRFLFPPQQRFVRR